MGAYEGRTGSSFDLLTIRTLEDIRPAAVAFHEMAFERLGLRAVVTCNLASRRPLKDGEGQLLADSVFGWTGPDERWWDDSRLAYASPLPTACRYESETFWVNAQGFHTRQPNPYLEKIDLNDFERRARCKAAMVVPVHLPFGQIGAAMFISSDKVDLSAEYRLHADQIGLMATRFITGCAKAVQFHNRLPADCQLTKREVECLRWASVGKTDREISMILGRSHATIRFHIQNAGEKLDAVNRSQSVFKAAQLGYLACAA